MVLSYLLPFVALVALLVAVPGPAVVLTMKNALLHGRRNAVLTACGAYGGDLVWVAASATGLTAVMAAYRPAFEALRFVGAAYLIYLGLRLLIHSNPISAGAPVRTVVPELIPTRRAVRQGVLCELSNPKTLLIFTSVIPQFAPSSASAANLAFLGIVFATLGFLSLIFYAIALSASGRLVRPKLVDRLTRASGGLLVGFGIGLAVEHAD